MRKSKALLGWCLLPILPSVTAAQAPEQPEAYVLEHSEAGWWKATSRVQVDWPQDRPVMSGLECTLSHERELQGGQPPMELSLSHPAESAEYRFRLRFNLPDRELSDRQVATITIGGRPYQRRTVQSRVVPWFGPSSPDGVVLTYGLARDMFRPDESYPWLPLEFLIPRFFEVESIKLGISGQHEVAHGDYETRFEEISIDMEGFREGLLWCFDQVNPPAGTQGALPAELRQRLSR